MTASVLASQVRIAHRKHLNRQNKRRAHVGVTVELVQNHITKHCQLYAECVTCIKQPAPKAIGEVKTVRNQYGL